MALNKVEICGVNTSKLPVLKAEEKEELFRRIKEGDEEARELYIKGNLRLVLSVIKRFSNSSENMDDLFSRKYKNYCPLTIECKIFHLCSAYDHWRDTKVSS